MQHITEPFREKLRRLVGKKVIFPNWRLLTSPERSAANDLINTEFSHGDETALDFDHAIEKIRNETKGLKAEFIKSEFTDQEIKLLPDRTRKKHTIFRASVTTRAAGYNEQQSDFSDELKKFDKEHKLDPNRMEDLSRANSMLVEEVRNLTFAAHNLLRHSVRDDNGDRLLALHNRDIRKNATVEGIKGGYTLQGITTNIATLDQSLREIERVTHGMDGKTQSYDKLLDGLVSALDEYKAKVSAKMPEEVSTEQNR